MKYTPILKGKEGEFLALKETFPETKNQIIPLIEFIKFTDKKSPKKTIDDFCKKVNENWGTQFPLFIETLEDSDEKLSENQHYLEYLFDTLKENNIKAIPVITTKGGSEYQNAITNSAHNLNNGICLRISDTYATKLEVRNIDFFLNGIKLTPENVDVIIDFKFILGEQIDILKIALTQIINNFPYLEKWRSLTLAATSFPIDLSSVKPSSIDHIKRGEWTLWKSLVNDNSLIRNPFFGDYVISNPDIIEVDPKMMKMSASIRYTTDEDWVILKGRNVKEHGFEQFFNLSEALINLPDYCGENFSSGDKMIFDCANRRSTSGNATTWRKIATNHHIQKVVSQLSSFGDF